MYAYKTSCCSQHDRLPLFLSYLSTLNNNSFDLGGMVDGSQLVHLTGVGSFSISTISSSRTPMSSKADATRTSAVLATRNETSAERLESRPEPDSADQSGEDDRGDLAAGGFDPERGSRGAPKGGDFESEDGAVCGESEEDGLGSDDPSRGGWPGDGVLLGSLMQRQRRRETQGGAGYFQEWEGAAAEADAAEASGVATESWLPTAASREAAQVEEELKR